MSGEITSQISKADDDYNRLIRLHRTAYNHYDDLLFVKETFGMKLCELYPDNKELRDFIDFHLKTIYGNKLKWKRTQLANKLWKRYIKEYGLTEVYNRFFGQANGRI